MSSRTWGICLVSCAVSFSAGFYLKWSQVAINDSSKLNNLNGTVSQQFPSEQGVKSYEKTKLHTTNQNLFTKKVVLDKVDDFLIRNKNIHDLNITNKMVAPFYQLLSELDEYQLQQKAEDLVDQLPNYAASRLLIITLETLAELQPQKALEISMSMSDEHYQKLGNIQSVFSIWSASSPEEALEWYASEDFSQTQYLHLAKDILSATVLNHLYNKNKSLALTKVSELLQQNKLTAFAMERLSESINQSNEFRSLLDVLSVSQFHDSGMVEVTAQWFAKAPQDAAAWVNMLDKEQKSPRLFNLALKNWIKSEPKYASDWYIKQFDEQQQSEAISKAATYFAREDPKSALEWVESLNMTNSQNAIYNILKNASYHYPDFVISNLDRVQDTKIKLSAFQDAIYSIYLNNPDKAQKLIDASEHKEALEAYIHKINQS